MQLQGAAAANPTDTPHAALPCPALPCSALPCLAWPAGLGLDAFSGCDLSFTLINYSIVAAHALYCTGLTRLSQRGMEARPHPTAFLPHSPGCVTWPSISISLTHHYCTVQYCRVSIQNQRGAGRSCLFGPSPSSSFSVLTPTKQNEFFHRAIGQPVPLFDWVN